ncbi:hypothetical protein HD553DRAFT_314707 [Filobasidium floriforme]|uniref:uncharacterized protein n=1 Tax=Filobasidium floriforme TaxID=5210 RepID=UPI001E8CB526|nr:uncharacterized protein HD553DRAFT_314707 [Filobasidium floriforme]KAH8082367.1 hypothetical protein HD553DRAFT_314707 [Filobasidium floriforme]
MSLKTTTLRANFSLSGRPNPNNITPPTSPLRSRIGITKHTSRPYTPGNSKPKPNGVAGPISGGVGAGSAGAGGVGGSAAGTSTLGSGSGLGTAGVSAGAAAGKKAPSKHIVWYREIVPAMMPVIGIGTAIFFALQLIQTHLSHSRSLHDAQIRITHLESELAHLQTIQRRQAASWGDSLGRVIKHVQKVAVGPSTTSTSGPAVGAGDGAAGAEDGKGATDAMTSTSTGTGMETSNASASISTPTQLQPTSTSAPLADKADKARRTVKEGLMDVESGMESLVDRVKDEFGVAVNEDGVSDGGRKRGRGWRGWVGL